ncbi:MAG TPA: enoyl-CoA hydratase-related protein [Acidimicrobiales bacterium]|nr:enoyl-CoA hydratase-related protein [Acidimicrobiales bacterium]
MTNETDGYSTIQLSVHEGIARLQLNRPESANTVNARLARELFDAATALRWDPTVRVVLLTSAGKVFCGGGDIAEFAEQGDRLPQHVARVTHDLHGAIQAFSTMDAPLVIAVGGSAGGAGLSLVSAGDLVLAGARAKFTMAYTRVGLTPDGSSSFYLARVVGLRRAMDLVLTNRVLTATEAEAWGLVNRVVADEELAEAAEELARGIASGPTAAYGAAKRLLLRGATSDLADAMARESEEISRVSRTPDAIEAVSAFLEKREARFVRP